MTKDDAFAILAILKAAYPSSFQVNGRSISTRDADALANLWEMQFKAEEYAAVEAAVNSLISVRTVGYSPAIGEVKEQLHRLRTAEELNEAEAWTLVEKACRRGLYNAREEFDKLPPAVQAAVGGPEQIKAWARMDAETVNSVVASNFRKTYRTVQIREKEKAMMPPVVKAFIAGVADNMKLGGGSAGKKPLPEHKAKPAMLPPKLEPMTAMPRADPPKPEPVAAQSEYKPMSEEDWEKRRDELMAKLQEHTSMKK